MVQGGYTRVGITGGYRGVLPNHLARGGSYQRSGPRKPCKGWSGWVGPGRTVSGGGDGQDHPAGPVRHPLGALPVLPSECRLWAIGARFDLISQKLSQNHEVSPKKHEKASHSPYISKRVREVTSWISQISISASLLLQGINGPF